MELLIFHQTAEWNALDRFGVQMNIMISVTTALIAVAFVALGSESQTTVLAAILVSVFVAALRQYTIEALDRYYARFLEAAVVQRKLRFLMEIGSDDKPPFDKDEYLEVSRRGDNSPRTGSELWIREFLEKGHNDVVWRIFRGLCWVGVILPVLASARLLNWQGPPATNITLTEPRFVIPVAIASLVGLGLVYVVGTKRIRRKRDDAYGRMPLNSL